MATRTLTLMLLTLTLGACALEPMDPSEDPTSDQASTLTTPDQTPGASDQPKAAANPIKTISAESPVGLPGDSLRTGDNPNKPQPDPWNPGNPVDGTSQQSAASSK